MSFISHHWNQLVVSSHLCSSSLNRYSSSFHYLSIYDLIQSSNQIENKLWPAIDNYPMIFPSFFSPMIRYDYLFVLYESSLNLLHFSFPSSHKNFSIVDLCELVGRLTDSIRSVKYFLPILPKLYSSLWFLDSQNTKWIRIGGSNCSSFREKSGHANNGSLFCFDM